MPARTSIKDRIVTVIKNAGAGPCANRVYIGRHNILPAAATGFPAAYVYMLREDVETLTLRLGDRSQLRTMIVAVDLWLSAADPDTFEDTADTHCASIEALVNVDITLNGTAKDTLLTSCEYLYDGTEEQPFGRAAMQWTVKYLSTET